MMASHKIGLISLGCSKNLTDSEYLIHKLQSAGFEVSADTDAADGIVINTCGFINDAKKESIDTICQAIHQKSYGKVNKIIVTGCLVERYIDDLKKELPEVDEFIQIKDYPHIGDKFRALFRNEDVKAPSEYNKKLLYNDYDKRVLLTPHHFAYLKIADGCNHKCGFCVIPKIRGRFQGRSAQAILNEANTLVQKGVKELILIAQDLTYYGHDHEGSCDLAGLLKKMVKISGLIWVRLLYLYPTTITDELIDLMAREEKICSYIDMPLQHASDVILQRMRRGYTQKHMVKLLEKIRTQVRHVTIRTTFIVGYPGEGKKDFNTLCAFIKNTPFDRLGVFQYSDEESAYAYQLDGKVSAKVKEQRYHELMGLQQSISNQLQKNRIGFTVHVLIDEASNSEGVAIGRTQGDAPEVDGRIFVTGANLRQGDYVAVRIEDSLEYDLVGKTVVSPKR